MKLVVQRCNSATVTVEGEVIGRVGRGMVVLLCVLRGDGPDQAKRLAAKLAGYRFFPDKKGLMNESALDQGLGALVISQFTLAADGRRGRRPSFDQAASPEVAEPLVDHFVTCLRDEGLTVETGCFGAHMEVALVNEGPVTLQLEDLPQGT
ncbi:MAG: D-tyrosyl-tRNA(Tyr) deacylase [Planctomycetes bacterium]|nr:D-tyrosyl-tRNA(Tyr) deacylase [Planctomycetota bacterium]